jgi:hypothetical protein
MRDKPSRELNLRLREPGDVVCPAPCPAAMIGQTAHADDRHAGRACGTITDLALGVEMTATKNPADLQNQ